MRAYPIRVRLTAWYFGVLAFSLLIISTVALLAIERSIYGAVDEDLRIRMMVVRRVLEHRLAPPSPMSMDDLQQLLRERSGLRPGGDLMQIADAEGNWIYRSRSMVWFGVPLPYQVGTGSTTGRYRDIALRLQTEMVTVNGQTYYVQVAAPIEEFREAMSHFRRFLFIAIPFMLLIATAGGYFMSRRALAPVDEIMDAAQKIGAQNLSNRLSVPGTGDELQRLSETLNGMLDRIEIAFNKITQFTADASHELRTPLAIMRTRAELSLRKARSADEYREELGQILLDLERTSDLVERLMLLARADSGTPILQSSKVDLRKVLETIADQGATLANSKDTKFTADLPSGPCIVKGDAHFLERLFLILVDNAVKYTPERGAVTLSCEAKDGFASIAVRDNGPGIPEAELPSIFERFYRADKARSRESGGAGLGLAIARWIVDAHKGTIEVESTVGRGSTFRVDLPLFETASQNKEYAAVTNA